ncbi:hypothetical protein BHE90_015221 [Fusarium euwallaceae]|uniref:Uncharacterized protein n=1 Tax=Fusarium euwallaceae TaxID=1147111 RepID=A0A430L3Q9_9HYPO|nr:hypothetical protein BHE90_015221 [Fusarium euwallaceae]
MPLLPEVAIELFNCFYNRERERIYTWAKSNGLLIGKKSELGPQIIWLRRCEISSGKNRVSFSIVVPNPREAQTARDELGTGEMTTAKDRLVAVSITSPIARKFAAQSRPNVEVGDVIILESDEGLAVSGEENGAGEVQGICLVSAVHVARFVGQGKGGWNEDIEEAGQSIA